jgi:transcriptional antiterminator Rof (Rho-off)
MTTDQRIARANRAQMAWDEFMAIQIEDMIGEYTARIVEIANSELSRDKRTDKITALSHAIRITENIRDGLLEAIRDGDVAKQEKLRADKIEGMTKPQRRLLGVAPF